MLLDLIRFGHVIGIALGLGLAIYADGRFLRALSRPIQSEEVRELRAIHAHVLTALALLWATGLMLLWVRTGFVVESFSPKLIFKVTIVSVLTTNALLIGSKVMPAIERAVGLSFAQLGFVTRMKLAVIGGISAACWLSLLALGIFRHFREMDGPAIAQVVQWFFIVPIGGAILVALIAPSFRPVAGGSGLRHYIPPRYMESRGGMRWVKR